MIASEPPLAGALLRLAFHDAAPRDGGRGGANGSIRFELDRAENLRLRRPLALLEEARTSSSPSLTSGPLTLSLADAIALAGAEAVETVGGPHVPIALGRADALVADPEALSHPLGARGVPADSRDGVVRTLPEAGLSSIGLRRYFGRLGLREPEWVALCAAHGLGRHPSLVGMSPPCLKKLTTQCLEDAPSRPPFIEASADRFGRGYFQALMRWQDRTLERGEAFFLPTDVALVVDGGLRRWVALYANDPTERLLRKNYARAYAKLVRPLAL
jgi:catalase (peroxidase I)